MPPPLCPTCSSSPPPTPSSLLSLSASGRFCLRNLSTFVSQSGADEGIACEGAMRPSGRAGQQERSRRRREQDREAKKLQCYLSLMGLQTPEQNNKLKIFWERVLCKLIPETNGCLAIRKQFFLSNNTFRNWIRLKKQTVSFYTKWECFCSYLSFSYSW